MKDLKVTLIQSSLHWEDIPANLQAFEEKIASIHSTDLVVLPEMFTTGFTMNSEGLSSSMADTAVRWMSERAKSGSFSLAGSMIITENQEYYNRLLYAFSDGSMEYYDKRHLFRMADEHHHFSAGRQRKIIEDKGWKINLQVCYDLRFPVWSRNSFNEQGQAAYDVIIYVANWPKARVNAWDKLLQARAIENQCYVIGVNRVGTDGKGIAYNGHSVVVDPKGNIMSTATEDREEQITVTISYQELEDFRKKFPVGLDAD